MFAELNILLHLRWLRSAYRVGKAMSELAPDDEALDRLLDDPVFIEEVRAFASVIHELRAQAAIGDATDLLKLQELGGQHHERALDALYLTAERLGVPPQDLMTVLTPQV